MIAAITGFFSALPEIVNLIKTFMDWVNHVSGNDPQGFIKKVADSFNQLNQADTPEKKADAAKSIADLISGL